MDFLVQWLRMLVGTAIIMGFLELILPEGDLRGFVRVVMGLLMILVLLQPLGGLLRADLNLERLLQAVPGPKSGTADVRRSAEQVSAAGYRALLEAERERLEAEIASYCSSQTLDGPAQVRVERAPEGGFRVSIRAFSSGDAARLKSKIAARYGLPEANVEVTSYE